MIFESLQAFAAASSDLLQSRALLKRTDTKFVVAQADLERVFPALSLDYAVLHTGTELSARYRTLYFDTPDMRCFHDHRRGRRQRFKVRVRHYLDREKTYLEIKRRGQLGTDKVRQSREFLNESLTAADWQFIDEATGGRSKGLQPELRNSFRRIMLVGLNRPERVTLDVDLCFEKAGAEAHLPNSAIVEVKQARLKNRSPILQALRAVGARPQSASKYCLGNLLLDSSLRGTRLGESLRRVQALERRGASTE